MAEVKIEEIREMFRKMRESANRALCFGDMVRELKREEKRFAGQRGLFGGDVLNSLDNQYYSYMQRTALDNYGINQYIGW